MAKRNTEEQLESQLKQAQGAVKEQWSELSGNKLEEAKSRYEQVQGQARKKLDTATKQVKQEVSTFVDSASQTAQEKAAEAKQRIDEKVSARPILFLVAALVVGLTVGLIGARRALTSS